VRAVGAHELDVRPPREALVPLDERPEAEELPAGRLAPDDRMRVADSHRRELDAFALHLERLRPPDLDRAEVDLDIAVLHPGRNRPVAETHAGEGDPTSPSEPHGGDPGAVPGQLGSRAVRVPDHDLRLGASHVDDLENPVGSHALVGIAEPPGLLGPERLGKLAPLEQQVRVPERVPLREPHRARR
jgi:hypothetical protein